MSEENSRAAQRAAREKQEAILVYRRLTQLRRQALSGRFDRSHLVEIHGFIFQDIPYHRPGEVRDETGPWNKYRVLEDVPGSYEVRYLGDGVNKRIAEVLDQFGGPEALVGLPLPEAATKLGQLYGDLDHAHGFYEGNSRTLREFTRTVALQAGLTLDWTGTGVDANKRNTLYIARDVAVLERAFRGLTPERGMASADRGEYETSLTLPVLRGRMGVNSLAAIIENGLSLEPARTVSRAPERPEALTSSTSITEPLPPGSLQAAIATSYAQVAEAVQRSEVSNPELGPVDRLAAFELSARPLEYAFGKSVAAEAARLQVKAATKTAPAVEQLRDRILSALQKKIENDQPTEPAGLKRLLPGALSDFEQKQAAFMTRRAEIFLMMDRTDERVKAVQEVARGGALTQAIAKRVFERANPNQASELAQISADRAELHELLKQPGKVTDLTQAAENTQTQELEDDLEPDTGR